MNILTTVLISIMALRSATGEQCACATSPVHVRNGAGSSHAILGTLPPGDCLSYKGDQPHSGSYDWAHVIYNGHNGYIAANWLTFRDCTVQRQCACATGNVHVRSGAGSSHSVLGTLTPDTCYPYKGEQTHTGGLDWAHIDYNGQDGWSAMNWLTIKTCEGSSTSGQQLPGCPRIVSRADWGARAPKANIGNLPSTPQNVYIHHGASSPCHDEAGCEAILKKWQNYHMDQHGWDDIGYTFVIGEDGNVYESRGWDKIGSHTNNHNNDGLGFCVIGDFTDHVPNAAALNALNQLIKCGVDNGKIRSDYILYGHRDIKATTTCPGQKFYELIQTWPHYKSPH